MRNYELHEFNYELHPKSFVSIFWGANHEYGCLIS